MYLPNYVNKSDFDAILALAAVGVKEERYPSPA